MIKLLAAIIALSVVSIGQTTNILVKNKGTLIKKAGCAGYVYTVTLYRYIGLSTRKYNSQSHRRRNIWSEHPYVKACKKQTFFKPVESKQITNQEVNVQLTYYQTLHSELIHKIPIFKVT